MASSTTLNRRSQRAAEESAAFGPIAERFRRAGDLDRAVSLCREGLQKFPHHISARVTLGWALLDQGKYDEARGELEQGIAELTSRCESFVAQEFVRGDGVGYFALCDHGHPVLEFAHRRLRDVRPSGSGSSLRESIPIPPALRDAGLWSIRVPQKYGGLGLDLVTTCMIVAERAVSTLRSRTRGADG